MPRPSPTVTIWFAATLRRTSVRPEGQRIQITVVVDIAVRERPPDLPQRKARPGRAADLGEAAPGRVVEQQLALHVGRARSEQRRVVEDVTVGDSQVEL